MAAEKGHMKVVKYLFENEADINMTNTWQVGKLRILLIWICQVLDLLVCYQWVTFEENYSFVDWLIDCLIDWLIEWLIDQSFYFCFYHQRTPLHVAAENGHTDIVKYLGNKVLDINITDKYGVGIIMRLYYYILIEWCIPVNTCNPESILDTKAWVWPSLVPELPRNVNMYLWEEPGIFSL